MQQETLYMNIGGLHDYASIFHLIFDIFYLNSSGHVLLLCGVRYLVTVYPIHSRQHLTVKAVGFCSLSMWAISLWNKTYRKEMKCNCFHDYYYFCSFACISNCKKCIYVHPLVHTHVIICPLFILGCYQCFMCICELFL